MDEKNLSRRQILGGVVAAAGAAGLGQLAPGEARAAEAAPAGAPPAPDLGVSQAPTITDVKDKVAYITGGSSGIGLGIARALHEQGAKVVLGNLDDKQFADALKMFPANDPRVATVVHDVMDRDAWEAKADEIESKFGPVHILVNNAGVGLRGGIIAGTYKDWDWGMGVNFWGPVYGCKTFVPRMRARPKEGCHIVTTTSTSGVLLGTAGASTRCRRWRRRGLMEQLRDDLRTTNIGTSTLMPGHHDDQHRPERNASSGSAAGTIRRRQPRSAAGRRAASRRWRASAASVRRPPGIQAVLGASAGSDHRGPAGGQRHPQQRPVDLPGAGIPAGRGSARAAMVESMVPFTPIPANVQAGIDANRYLFTPMYAQEVAHRRATRKRTIPGI